jgi:putative ABC transport system permease protein
LLIRFIGVIVPRRFRARFRQEWEAELEYREDLLSRWDRLDWRHKLELLWRGLGAFWDAMWLQRQRLEEDMFQDLRFGLRMLLKNPGFTTIAALTLALGIGANTALFSVVNAVLLRPLPYQQPDRLVILWERTPMGEASVAYPNFVDWRERNQVFERITAFRRDNFNLTGAGEAERLNGRMVSAGFFATFGKQPARGRDFTSADDQPGAAAAVILSHDFWRRRFGGDEKIVGSQLTLSNRVFTVIGIAASDFRFGGGADAFVPLGLFADRFRERGAHPGIFVVGRLKPGVNMDV